MQSNFIPLAGVLCLVMGFFPPLASNVRADAPGKVPDHLTKILANCEACHGSNGVSEESDVPTIAGLSVIYTVDNMTAYREEERPCPETEYHSGEKKGEKTDMCQIAEDLSEEETQQLAEYLAGVTFVPAKQEFDAALAAKGKAIHDENCEKCHADGGRLASDDAGILGGQWMPYLEQTFKEYNDGDRQQPKKMKKKMKLKPAEFEALLYYYGSLQ